MGSAAKDPLALVGPQECALTEEAAADRAHVDKPPQNESIEGRLELGVSDAPSRSESRSHLSTKEPYQQLASRKPLLESFAIELGPLPARDSCGGFPRSTREDPLNARRLRHSAL